MAIRIRLDPAGAMLLAAFLVADIFAWLTILTPQYPIGPHVYFLGIPRGESSLMIMSDGTRILIDAGADDAAVKTLEKILPPGDHHIDLAIISRPDGGTIGGFPSILEYYEIGALLYNGRAPSPSALQVWDSVLLELHKRNVPLITVGAGDEIRVRDEHMSIISPNNDFATSPAASDASLVEIVRTKRSRALFTGGIGTNVVGYLAKHISDFRADILQLYPESPFFNISGVKMIVFEGKPTKEMLAQAASSTHARLLRTDIMGTVNVRMIY